MSARPTAPRPGLQVYETTVDGGCEQQEDFEIVRCTGHQHIGSKCITMYNAETNERICQSCPVYGTVRGACGFVKVLVAELLKRFLNAS